MEINKIILSSLLASTMLMNLPLNGQAPKREKFKVLRKEIGQIAYEIQKTVKRFEKAKKIVPILVGAAGVALTAVASAITAALLLIPLNNLKRANKHLNFILKQKSQTHGSREAHSKHSYTTVIKKLKSLLSKSFFAKKIKNIDPPSDYYHMDRAKHMANKAKPFIEKELKKVGRIAFKTVPIGIFAISLLGITGTAIASIGSFFGMSALSVSTAFKKAKKLESLEKKHPGILTRRQKILLEKLDNISKDVTMQAVIKNLRKKKARTEIVNEAIQQHSSLVKEIGGKEKARKLFDKYIRLKWQEKTFQQTVDNGKGVINLFVVKLRLKFVKGKVKKLETQYRWLKENLKNSVQAYTTQVNLLLEELKQQMIEAAEKGKLKPGTIPQQTISL